MVVTARAEAALLPENLRYHRLLGVERAYVYLDASGPDARRAIEPLPGLEVLEPAAPQRFAGEPAFERCVAGSLRWPAARQILNTADAIERARAAGFDWLLALDADELVALERGRGVAGSLPTALAGLEDRIGCARFSTLEVVQRRFEVGNPFQETLFKRPSRRHRRRIAGLGGGRVALTSGFLGHRIGKCAVRLAPGVRPEGVHQFVSASGARLPEIGLGDLLHFHSYCFRDWLKRAHHYADHPKQHLSGVPVSPTKLAWSAVVVGGSVAPSELERYYREVVLLSPRAVERLRRPRWWRPGEAPAVVEVRAAALLLGLAPDADPVRD